MPVDEKHFNYHKSGPMKGKPLSRCKACQNWSKLVNKNGPHGYVMIGHAEILLVTELLDRCGSPNAVRQKYGLRPETLRTLTLAREPVRVQKRTIQRILVALSEQRKHDRMNGGTSERYRARRVNEAVRDQRMFG